MSVFIPYKNRSHDINLFRNIMLLRRLPKHYARVDDEEMPEDYDINELKNYIENLTNGVDNEQIDTIKTNLYSITMFLGRIFDLVDSQETANDILDSFNDSNFIDDAIAILKNDPSVDNIVNLFEIILRVFNLIIEYHPIQDKVTQDLIIPIAEIVKSPSIILPEPKRNIFSQNITLFSLYETNEGVKCEDYDQLQTLGISALANLCSSRNDLLEFAYYNFCPMLYNSFIEGANGCSDAIFELIRFFDIILAYYSTEFTTDELKPFTEALIVGLKMEDDEFRLCSLKGLIYCVQRNPGIADEFIKKSIFEEIHELLRSQSDEIQSETLIFISEIFCTASRTARNELAKNINWRLVNFIGQNEPKILSDSIDQKNNGPKAHYTFCTAISEIMEYSPWLIDDIFNSGICDTITSMCISGNFNLKDHALQKFLKIAPKLSSIQIDQLLNNNELIELLVEFLIDVKDETSIVILNTLSKLFSDKCSSRVVQHLYENGLFEQIEQTVELLQNVENDELVIAASDFSDLLTKYKQSLEEENEVGLN